MTEHQVVTLMPAEDLHRRASDGPPSGQPDPLAENEFWIYGAWRRLDATAVQHYPGPPPRMYVEFPDGKYRVPLDGTVPMRPVAA